MHEWSRRAAAAMLAGAPLVVAHAQDPHASPASVFPARVDQVVVDVLVLDDKGKPVEGLGRDDFTLKEDGKPQTVELFEAVVVPESADTTPARRTTISTNAASRSAIERTFVIVFDDANIGPYTTPHARSSVARFIREGLRAGDDVTIVPTAGGSWWTGRLPESRDSLLAYADKLEGKYRPDSGAARIWDHEAAAIWNGNDPRMISYVARRWFENGLIPESYPTDREARAALDVSPGLALIRSKAGETYRSAVGRLRLTLDTVARIAESLASQRGRKNVLLVTEGFIMDASQPEFREVVRAARRSNVVIHFLDVRSPEGALGQAGMPGANAEQARDVEERDTTTVLALAARADEGARSVALDTGGEIVPATGRLAEAMGKIAAESRAYYLLGFVSTNPKRDGAYRKLSVSVARPNLDVRARRGYYAPKDDEPRTADPDHLDPAVRAALDSPKAAGGVPLRLASYVFGGSTGKSTALLVAEIGVGGLDLVPRAGTVSAAFETYVVVYGRESPEPFRQEKIVEMNVPEAEWRRVAETGITIRREFELPAGEYQARLLVREKSTGQVGMVLHAFDVPSTKALRTSTPILTDTLQEVPGGPRPVPVAHRTFRPEAKLGFAYDVYGAQPDPGRGGPRVFAGYVVRRANGGAAVSNGPSRQLQPAGLGRLSQVVVFAGPVEPGEYEFVLELKDEPGGISTQVVEPFTIAR